MVRHYFSQAANGEVATNTNNSPQGISISPLGVLPLDLVPGATYAYSTRLLRTRYTGDAMEVERSSDNQKADIGFDINGDLDTVALLAHTGTGISDDGTVTKWYDQSGNGEDMTPTNVGNDDPFIVKGGIVVTSSGNSRPILESNLTTTNSSLSTPNNYGAFSDSSSFTVYEGFTGTQEFTARVVGSQVSAQIRLTLSQNGSNDMVFFRFDNDGTIGTTFRQYNQVSGFVDILPAPGSIDLWQNGVNEDTNTLSGIPTDMEIPWRLFASGAFNNFLRGQIGEHIHYKKLVFTSRSIIETDQKDYWGTP